MSLPLAGITVVAVEQAVAAPLATRNLADLGARVIKVERLDGGDLARGYNHAVHGTGAHFVWLNRGKESLAVDLRSAPGQDVVSRLVSRADVFLQNLAPGAARQLGFSADVLREDHPELVVVDMSGYGTGGPMEQRKAYDMLIQAEAGLISLTGTPETAVKTGIPTSDIAAAMYASQAVLAALLRRWRTGEGASIEVSMLEATVEWLGHAVYTQMYSGHQPPRMGLSHSSIAPYDRYPTSDGEVLIGVQSDSAWRTFTTDVLDAPGLQDDSRFTTNVSRVLHRTECDAAIASRTSRLTTQEMTARLASARVPAAQINQVAQVLDHPQLRARDRWRTIGTEYAEVRALLPPATFDDVEARMGDVPALGQHTLSLLHEAGLSEDEADGAVARRVFAQTGQHQPTPA